MESCAVIRRREGSAIKKTTTHYLLCSPDAPQRSSHVRSDRIVSCRTFSWRPAIGTSLKQRLIAARRRVVRPLAPAIDWLYYRHIFGRPLPFATQFAERFLAWEQRRFKGDVPISREAWERQYRSGSWTLLRRLDELAHYMVLVGYLQYLKPNAAVLDVGCGEGLLLRHYRPHGYGRYVGIDFSKTALAKIQDAEDKKTTFICADAETYEPTERFDAIVLNGILCYFYDPIGTVERYERALNPGGLLLVCAYMPSKRDVASLRALSMRYPVLDETIIKNGNKTWVCSALQPKVEANCQRAKSSAHHLVR